MEKRGQGMFREEKCISGGFLECNSALNLRKLRNDSDEMKDSALTQERYVKWLGHCQ